MSVVSMKQLLEAGVHFGHQTRRWNPKMAPYIYMERNGIYIIDLQKTVRKLEEAYSFVRDVSQAGGSVLFVGTKKQAADAIKEEAERVGMFYVNARWLGGMLTNFKTMRMRIDRLAQLRKMQEDGTFDILPKKEVIKLTNEINKLEKYLGGVKEMKRLPAALFIIDPRKERNAIAEARKLGIPIVAIVDTNCDPDEIDYLIPGNDDAIRAIRLISQAIASAVVEGRQGVEMVESDETAISETSYLEDDEPKEAAPAMEEPMTAKPMASVAPVAARVKLEEPKVVEPIFEKPIEPEPEPKSENAKVEEPVELESELQEPKPEEPIEPEPKPEEPVELEPKPEEPKVVETAQIEADVDVPKVDEAKSATPDVEEPKAEAQAEAEPKAAKPKATKPKSTESKEAKPKTAPSKTAATKAATSKAAASTAEDSKPTEQKAAKPKAEKPKTQKPKAEKSTEDKPKTAKPKAAKQKETDSTPEKES